MSKTRTAIESIRESNQVRFYNDTGAPITINRVYTDDGNILLGNSVVGKQVPYQSNILISLKTAQNNGMLKKFPNTVKIDYITADNRTHTHQFPANSINTYNRNFPTEINIMLALNDGAPRVYKLNLYSGRLAINGVPYYMDDYGHIALYLKLDGGTAYWVINYDGLDIARGTHRWHVSGNLDIEQAYLMFPMDCSYYGGHAHLVYQNRAMGRHSTTNYNPRQGTRGYSAYESFIPISSSVYNIRYIFLRIMDNVGGYKEKSLAGKSIGFTTPTVDAIIKRADRQQFRGTYNTTSAMYNIGVNPIYHPNQSKRDSYIMELRAQHNGNTIQGRDDLILEWEAATSDGQVNRFITQYGHFTVDMEKLGFKLGSNVAVAVRCRVHMIGPLMNDSTTDPTQWPPLGAPRFLTSRYSSWSVYEETQFGCNLVLGVSNSKKSWFKTNIYNNNGIVDQDCGWDTKMELLVISNQKDFVRNYPMLYAGDNIAAGVGNSQHGEINNKQNVNFELKYTYNAGYFASATLSTTTGQSYTDPSIYIRDTNAHWGGYGVASGTYAEGFQCCGTIAADNEFTGGHNNRCSVELQIDESGAGGNNPTFIPTPW